MAHLILDHQLGARQPKTLFVIAAIWVFLAVIYVGFNAAWWVVLPIALFTLPALFEAGRGDVARLTLDTERLTWSSRRHSGDASLNDIDYVRFDTRMDFAINARLYLVNGATVRLPVECVPPYRTFCAALDQVGIRHERHHFSLF